MAQLKKDSEVKRVNFDNTRVDKFDRDVKEMRRDTASKGSKLSKPNRGSGNNNKNFNKRSGAAVREANKLNERLPQLSRAAASFTFAEVAGTKLPFLETNLSTVPGAMGLYWTPSIGGHRTEAFNTEKDSVYSFTVHANSRNTSYTAADQAMFIMAGAEVFAAVASLIRLYGCTKRFVAFNVNAPKVLVNAMGASYSNVKYQLSQMWFEINDLIRQTRQIWIPKQVKYLQEWFDLNSNVYVDGESIKAQYYLYVQRVYHKLSEKSSTKGTSLVTAFEMAPDPNNFKSWVQLRTNVQTMIDALVNSEDRGIIFGDLLKAYGPENMYKLDEIPADYLVEPLYDMSILARIHNTIPNANYPSEIRQDDDENLYNHYALAASTYLQVGLKDLVLDFKGADPTPEFLLNAVRHTLTSYTWATQPTGATPTPTNKFVVPYITECDYVTEIYIWATNNSQRLFVLTTDTTIRLVDSFYMSVFDWSPIVYAIDSPDLTSPKPDGKEQTVTAKGIVHGDLDNFTPFNTNEINKMHISQLYRQYEVQSF